MFPSQSLEAAAQLVLRKLATDITRAIRAEVARAVAPALVASYRVQRRSSRGRRAKPSSLLPLRAVVAQLERDHIERALDANDGSVARASRALGIPVTTMKYKLKKYRIR